ncbi:Undecaprenyl-phosphate galactosephosphotransferase [hydrothermal vent metagenome]|uniref:Undecaprenyl-phosphate galactosephosphotransferase n=1 Tax=hydrothermal vent metagenome TaxID=652676 RepID=A0A3B1DRW8_9ZZZZ
MLQKHAFIFRRLMMFADICLVSLAFFLGYIFRNNFEGAHLNALSSYLWILPIFISLWITFLYIFGMYASFRLKRVYQVLFIIFQAAFCSFIILNSLNYLLKVDVSRAFVFLIFVISIACLVVEKIILIKSFRSIRKKGFNFRHILIVGTGPRAKNFIKHVDNNKEFGLCIVGLVDQDESKVGEMIEGCEVLGALKDISAVLRNQVIDQVIFIVPRSWLSDIEEAILHCEIVGIKVSVAIDLFNLKFAHVKEEGIFGVPLVTFDTTPPEVGPLLVKRLFDIVTSGIALFLLIPVFIVVAILVKKTSKGSVFFKQIRVGVNGRKFMLYKFRTMCQDAEQKLEELKEFNEMEGHAFKMTNDPRITSIGKFLRKFSIDELPQIWNVFTGDMSVVGPRPPIVTEVEKYDHWQRRKFSMRPGITCIWQVEGRNKIVDFNEWMELDLQYIDNWSLAADFKILCRTVPVVLFGVGAK